MTGQAHQSGSAQWGQDVGHGVLLALLVAAASGMTHGLFSLYWAAGGNWLLDSLGQGLVEEFADKRWVLAPVAAVKIGFALFPLFLARLSWPLRRLSRAFCWVGAAALLVWGGANTLVGNLVLAGVIDPADSYDQKGMVGHAWLWDPLFLVWGIALAMALVLTRRGGSNR